MHAVRSLAFVALALALPVAARGQVLSSAMLDTGRTIISASGSARATSAPDRATLTVLVEPQAMSVEEAGTRLAAVQRAVLDTLRTFNLPAGSIQTVNGGVSPYRNQMSPQSGPSFAGRTSIRIELNRLDLIPALTGAMLSKGATVAVPASYAVAAADSVRRGMIPQAVAHARREAEALASAAGGHLGRLLDVASAGAPVSYGDQLQNVMISGMMYDNGQRISPATVTQVTVSTRWLFVPDSR